MNAHGIRSNAEAGLGALSKPRRVLIVDDDDDFGESLAVLLRDEGHEVRCAHDGPEAIDQAARWAPELVLLDVVMPGLDGFATARRLRREHGDTQMLVVVTSAADLDEAILAEAGEAGFDRCVDKADALPAVREILARDLPPRFDA